ncbi:MAG: hypothetical protein OMM_06025 [Candidatus Magnetoglobus multicellularis str. Araruama]|uniref:Right handed beta helix domain-containing protein n=1 Tax=Candidatus Magnetoglobus multicellularis str. Araruama TaxID=890399 RepID=A0A1V1NSF9_9BACT|nr:MAG: hypothetical protein OMM_06025 [Candidatus Magnetoglobus multicellularis str. Araruama]
MNAGNVILDGEERDRVLSINSGENKVNVSLDRLTIQNGRNVTAGLLIETKGEVLISYSCLINNNASMSSNGIAGCSIYTPSKTMILHTTIQSNTGHSSILKIKSNETTLDRNKISNNVSGVVVYIYGKEVTVKDNDFSYNQGRQHSFYAQSNTSDSLAFITNNSFFQNSSNIHIAFQNSNDNVIFTNNLVLSEPLKVEISNIP